MLGVINLIKPSGMTSHDVVAFVRRQFPRKTKVGHLGTLDPLAMGVLPVAVGRATKWIPYIRKDHKRYRAKFQFGFSTNSHDLEGEIVEKKELSSDFSLAVLEEGVQKFRGDIEQVPPLFSAVKIDGKRCHQYAREGAVVTPKKRAIHIARWEILDWSQGVLSSVIDCIGGTYIRSLVRDLGQEVDCPCVLSQLIRQQDGSFDIGSSWTLREAKELIRQDRWQELYTPVETVFSGTQELQKLEVASMKEGQLYRYEGQWYYLKKEKPKRLETSL